MARVGAAIVAGVAALALLSLVWTPWDVTVLDVAHRLAPPDARHLLGTDQLGRDMLSMLMAGARPSLGVALLAVAIGVAVGVPAGLLAAGRGGWVDEVVARAGDVLFAFPAIVLALLVVAVLGPGAAHAGLAIGLFNIPVFARVTRGAARGVWARDFILAARLAGRSEAAIARVHVLPIVMGPILVQATVQLALGLLAEAGLSFLGTQPPQPSWGRMLADAQTFLGASPRLVLLPGLAIVVTVLGINLAGEGLRRRWAGGGP